MLASYNGSFFSHQALGKHPQAPTACTSHCRRGAAPKEEGNVPMAGEVTPNQEWRLGSPATPGRMGWDVKEEQTGCNGAWRKGREEVPFSDQDAGRWLEGDDDIWLGRWRTVNVGNKEWLARSWAGGHRVRGGRARSGSSGCLAWLLGRARSRTKKKGGGLEQTWTRAEKIVMAHCRTWTWFRVKRPCPPGDCCLSVTVLLSPERETPGRQKTPPSGMGVLATLWAQPDPSSRAQGSLFDMSQNEQKWPLSSQDCKHTIFQEFNKSFRLSES